MRASLLLLLISVLLAGCVSVNVGSDEGKVQTQYLLSDLSPTTERRSTPIPRRLLVTPVPSSVGETFAIAYSRAAQQRAFYQFASWADRPSTRFARLLVDRIEARGMFTSVAALGSNVGGDLLLNVLITEVLHDVPAGTGHVEAQVELIERRGRRLVARQRFAASVPTAQENAPAAVDAMSRAATTILDQILPWLEKAAESLPPPQPR